MRSFIAVAAAALVAVSVGLWLSGVGNSAIDISAVSPERTASPATSIWDMHNQAHLEFLPVQHIDDQSVIFSQARR